MAKLSKDVRLDEQKFLTAAQEMRDLKVRASTLRDNLQALYQGLADALQSESGKELELAAEDVVLEPIDNLMLVINQMSDTLDTIIGTGYYNDIFRGFEDLRTNL